MKLLRAVVANRALARLELAWAAAALGNWAFSIVLAVYAYRQGGTEAVALALVVRMLPAAVAAPYAAMLVDRHSRRAVLQGDFFGEIALLHDVPRTATVTALGPVTALAIDRDAFLAAVSGHARSAAAAQRLARGRLDGDAPP